MHFQGIIERLWLETTQHSKKRGLRVEQAVGRISRIGCPHQCNARHSCLDLQHRTLQIVAQRRGHLLAPRKAPGRRHCGRHTGEAPGGLDQPAGQCLLVRRQRCLLQQRSSGQHIDGHVHPDVRSCWRKHPGPTAE